MNKQRAAFLSIISNTCLIVFKIIAGVAMNSVSVISEAVHSSIDLLASLIAFISIKKAAEPEDKEHQFGHGKYENVSGFVEAILIAFAAIFIIYEAVKKIVHGVQIESVGPGLIVMGISSIVNFIISKTLLKISKKTDSIALEADAMHLLTDVYTSMGVFVGLLVIRFTGIKIFDPIVAIMVALLIMKASLDLTKKSIKDLVDESLPDEEINKIIDIVKRHENVMNYHKLRTRRSGEKREIDIHLQVPDDMSLINAHRLCDEIEGEIKAVFPRSYIVVHVEPDENNKELSAFTHEVK